MIMNNILASYYQIENNNMNEMNDVVSVMFDYFRLNKEKLITDYTRLLIDHVHAPFRKA